MLEATKPARAVVERDEIQRIENLPPEELDKLPIGAIQLDREGKILSYNQTEARLAERQRDAVVGRDFFREVAPCTNVQEFAGRFREGMERRELHATFPYLFDYEMAPRHVWVTLFYSDLTQTGWVFVRDTEGSRAARASR